MFTKQNNQEQEQEKQQETQGKEEYRKRLNPRLVFTDPESFFSDLLMEQNEQG